MLASRASRASLADILDSLRVVAIPTRTRFRGITVREAALFEGPQGWTEFSPFLEYGDAEAAAWLAGAIDFGWTDAPPLVRDTIEVNATIPAVPAAEVSAVLARFPGCRTAKVKVAEKGQSLADDVARVAETVQLLGTGGRVRVDANCGWSVSSAEEAIAALNIHGLEYVEQPCATVDELAELRRRLAGSGVLIAADESVRKAADPVAVARRGAADIIVVKAQPLGGIHSALEISAATGLPTVVSSALDTSVGLSMGLHLAGALPKQPYASGLGTAALLSSDVTDDALLPVDGSIRVRRVEPSAALLTRLQASPDRSAWWADRIARCYAQLEAGPAAG